MKKIKKIAASLMAVTTMAMSMVGINAGAAVNANPTVTKPFSVGYVSCTASVTFSTGVSYYATTSCGNATVNYRAVSGSADLSNGGQISGYYNSSVNGTAAINIVKPSYATISKCHTGHSASSDSLHTAGSTYFVI